MCWSAIFHVILSIKFCTFIKTHTWAHMHPPPPTTHTHTHRGKQRQNRADSTTDLRTSYVTH